MTRSPEVEECPISSQDHIYQGLYAFPIIR
ncbi:hypothetical protein ABH927_002922 [Planotetraspora sp. GP83]